ncbi:MAG: hypothetical protein ACM31C_20055 [Acidobacteriota bacterium]
MPRDRRRAWRVASLALICGCGPKVAPSAPPPEPGPVARPHKTPISSAGREVVVGEWCPQGAGGRPAVAPLVMRTVQWSDVSSEVTATVERGSVPRFVVFGTDGKMAGVFDPMGLVDVGLQQPVASGAYTGASPCTYEVTSKPNAGQLATRAEDPKCGQFLAGCGLAVGEIGHPDDGPETVAYQTGGACMTGDQLAVDIDGDGKVESFPITGVLDGIRGPAAEWTASPTAEAACTPRFQLYDLKLAPAPDPGKPVDQKAIVYMDLLGVVDLDADGRKELVIALRFPTVRSIVVYSASQSAQRLELVGEATGFPR